MVAASGASTSTVYLRRVEIDQTYGSLMFYYSYTNKPANTYIRFKVTDSAGKEVDTLKSSISETGDGGRGSGAGAYKKFTDGKITIQLTMKDDAGTIYATGAPVDKWVVCDHDCDGSVLAVYDTEADYIAGKDSVIKGNHVWSTTEITAATCTSANEVQPVCTKCKLTGTKTSTVAALGHDYTSVVTKAATTEEEGIRTYTCTRCNDSYTETIAKLAGSTQTNPADPAAPGNTPDTGNTPDSNTGEENDPETSTESTEPTQNNNSNNDSNNDSTQTSMAADNTTTQMTSPKTDEMNIPALLAGICIVAFCIAGYLGEVQKTKRF